MQNKPNFQKTKMNLTPSLTVTYENMPQFQTAKNKPNQTQFQSPHYVGCWLRGGVILKDYFTRIFSAIPLPSITFVPFTFIINGR